jgi:hypothetical protein
MTSYRFSKQEVVELLPQLKEPCEQYPPEMLAAQRELFLDAAVRLVKTRSAVNTNRRQRRYSIMHEATSMIVKALIVIFAGFLIAFVVHSIVTGNANFEWLSQLLSY